MLDAFAEGRRVADEIRPKGGRSGTSRPARRRVVLDALVDQGFEPRAGADGTIVLRNCPFHHLAEQHTELICGMNLCLLRSTVDGVGQTGLEAVLEPEDDQCCVKLRPV